MMWGVRAPCLWCGLMKCADVPLGHTGGDSCGKKRKTATKCYTCNSEGHMARDCPNTRCHYCGISLSLSLAAYGIDLHTTQSLTSACRGYRFDLPMSSQGVPVQGEPAILPRPVAWDNPVQKTLAHYLSFVISSTSQRSTTLDKSILPPMLALLPPCTFQQHQY